MHILIVGETVASAEYVGNLLQDAHRNGDRYEYADSTEHVLGFLNSGQMPDVVVVELDLYGIRFGYKVLQFFYDGKKFKFPVIALVEPCGDQLTAKLTQMGCVVYRKPCDGHRLLETIGSAVKLHKLENDVLSVQMETLEIIANMAEAKEGLSSKHINAVGFYASSIAGHLGFSVSNCKDLLYAAKLHDLGKMYVPESILNKKTKLTDVEYDIIKSHTWLGLSLIDNVKFNMIIKKAEDVILHHHENYDGSGYPEGLAADNIPFVARIVRVSDVYDALVSERVYKKGWPAETAVSYLNEQSGKLFDPHITEVFIEKVIGW